MKFLKKKNEFPKLYTVSQAEQLEEYIEQTFGEFELVLHEIVSPDIHVDIVVVPPTDEKDYYTLVTMGMGAHEMNTPKELSGYGLQRAEIIMHLPKDWAISSDDEIWYWPIRWLKILARLPMEHNTWLGFGHTIPNGEPFADNTELCCALLISATDEEREYLELDEGDIVNFYQLFPIYKEEMDFKIEQDTDALLELLAQEVSNPPIDIKRKNFCLN